jgi:signal transduction histidine kinase
MAAAQKGIAFTVQMDPRMHDDVRGDGYRLGQILNNLINNAIKFTESGLVQVQVAQERRNADSVLLKVTVVDTGIGISAPQLAELFQPFVQVDVSTSRRYGGSGLGLVISRSLAHAMGGTLEVSSEPRVGSRFTLSLPLRVEPSRAPPVKAEDEVGVVVTSGPPGAIHRGP